MRCITGHATALDTMAKATNPIQDTAMAGMNALSELGEEQVAVGDREVQQRLERLALLLAGERVGGQHGRDHQRHDQEQRGEQVAVDEHDELLAGRQREDRVGEVARHRRRGACRRRGSSAAGRRAR